MVVIQQKPLHGQFLRMGGKKIDPAKQKKKTKTKLSSPKWDNVSGLTASTSVRTTITRCLDFRTRVHWEDESKDSSNLMSTHSDVVRVPTKELQLKTLKKHIRSSLKKPIITLNVCKRGTNVELKERESQEVFAKIRTVSS